MNKGGRPRDPVWIHFDEVSKDGKSYARCKKCCHELFSKVGRMKAHNQKCNNEGDKEVNSNLADACDIWLKLKSNPALEPHKRDVLRRFGQAMTTEHLVAYKLHPKYQGKNLSLEQINAVHSYLMNIDASFMATLVAFEGQSTPFHTAYFSGVATAMSPTQWWRAVKGCGVDEKFSDFANNLLSCPASSASIERIFSNFAFVHTKVRNRLGIEKASNLVFCYRMLRGCNELDY